MKQDLLNVDRLREALHYDPLTGIFTRIKTSQPSRWCGKPAGSYNKVGYCYINILGGLHLAHRLAWLYMHGEWPNGSVDHINGNPSDNRICNLRVASHAENMQNLSRAKRGSASGVLGVHKKSRNAVKPWSASITINRKKIHIGCFDTVEKAHAAYVQAKRKLHPAGVL